MTLRNDHIRALELMALPKSARRGVPQEQSAWLEQHLLDCPPCTEQSQQIDQSLNDMRQVSTSISATSALVRHTQLRVRQRAYELNQQDELMQPLWIACMLALGWVAFSVPFLWEGMKWLGSSFGMPELIWQSIFVITWLMPPSIGAGVSAARRKKAIA
jgi:hypothetical protein